MLGTKLLQTSTMIGAMVLAPALSMAAGPCVASPKAPDSYNWGSSQRAFNLLEALREDAQQVGHYASALENLQNAPSAWKDRARQLERVEAEINEIRKRLCRLGVIQNGIVPAELNAMHHAAPLVQGMTNDIDDAIYYLDTHRGAAWATSYQRYVRNLDTEADTLARAMDRYEVLANAQNREMYLAKNGSLLHENLGMLMVFGK